MTTNHTSKAATSGCGRVLSITFWVVQILFAAYFLWSYALPKFTGDAYWVDLFGQIGIGQWFRYFTGVVEVLGAIGLVIPQLAGIAAIGLALTMIGAMFTQLVIVDDPGGAVPALIVFVVVAFIAWVRWPDTRALAGGLRR